MQAAREEWLLRGSPALVEKVGEKPRNRGETKVHPADDQPMRR